MTSIGIFHENFAQSGGAERVAEAMARVFPEADVLTTVAVRSRLSAFMKHRGVRTTWMQILPGLDRWYRFYLAAYPLAVRSTPSKQYDLLLSSCFGFAKGLRRAPHAVHICYCHTPPRWIWRAQDYMARERWGLLLRTILKMLIPIAKSWDVVSAGGPDVYLANSTAVQERLFCFYGRESEVLYPPIELERFHASDGVGDHYLVVSRLVGYKRIDLAIKACNRLGRGLKIVGDGPDRKRLERLAGPKIEFLGRLPDHAVVEHLAVCRALLFPGEEDFGLTPLEANASGRPVVAFAVGGALETVIDGETGVLFNEPSAESLADGMVRLESLPWKASPLQNHARKFSLDLFSNRLRTISTTLLKQRGLTKALCEVERASAE